MSDLICVGRFLDPTEALVAKSALEAQGISVVFGEHHVNNMMPHLNVATFGSSLHVPEEQAYEARRILGAARDRQAAISNEPIGADVSCPKCGGMNFKRQRHQLWTLAAIGAFMPFIPYGNSAECLSCGEIIKNDTPLTIATLYALVILAYVIAVYFLLTDGLRIIGSLLSPAE
ncbi:MAG: hypothetical protein R3C60_04940 [Parvularculaceae bacterium]